MEKHSLKKTANILNRLMAYLIDHMIFIIMHFALMIAGVYDFNLEYAGILYLLYFVFSESSKWQASLGKKIMGLSVVDYSGGRISIFRASFKGVILLVIIMLPYYFNCPSCTVGCVYFSSVIFHYFALPLCYMTSFPIAFTYWPVSIPIILVICAIPMFFTKDALCIQDILTKTKVVLK